VASRAPARTSQNPHPDTPPRRFSWTDLATEDDLGPLILDQVSDGDDYRLPAGGSYRNSDDLSGFELINDQAKLSPDRS
jgi:hypothetical protein